jgi:hypothetical protein
MRGKNPVQVSDAYGETAERLVGGFLIEASSYDAALGAARDCPTLEYGGTIAVREIDLMATES